MRRASEAIGVEDGLSRKRSRGEEMWEKEGDPAFNHPEELKIEMGGVFSLKPTPKERVAMVLSGQDEGHLSSLQMPGVLWPSPGLSSEGTLPSEVGVFDISISHINYRYIDTF